MSAKTKPTTKAAPAAVADDQPVDELEKLQCERDEILRRIERARAESLDNLLAAKEREIADAKARIAERERLEMLRQADAITARLKARTKTMKPHLRALLDAIEEVQRERVATSQGPLFAAIRWDEVLPPPAVMLLNQARQVLTGWIESD